MVYAGYCTIAEIKERCLISDSSHDTQMEIAGTEASRFIDEEIRPYVTSTATAETAEPFVFKQLPLTAAYIPAQIAIITADLAAAIFMRRHIPEKYWELWDRSGKDKLETFIKLNWYRGNIYFVGVT
jgi:hypothetical protein